MLFGWSGVATDGGVSLTCQQERNTLCSAKIPCGARARKEYITYIYDLGFNECFVCVQQYHFTTIPCDHVSSLQSRIITIIGGTVIDLK